MTYEQKAVIEAIKKAERRGRIQRRIMLAASAARRKALTKEVKQ